MNNAETYLTKSRSREIGWFNGPMKFDVHLGNAAADGLVLFQSDWKCLNPNIETSSLHEILR